jgi:hypothetical protein
MAVLLNLLKAGLVLRSCTTRGQAAPPPPNGISLKGAATHGLADQFRDREVTSPRTSLLVNSSGRSSSAILKLRNRSIILAISVKIELKDVQGRTIIVRLHARTDSVFESLHLVA